MQLTGEAAAFLGLNQISSQKFQLVMSEVPTPGSYELTLVATDVSEEMLSQSKTMPVTVTVNSVA